MVRRIAGQVHQQAARLLRSNYLAKEPIWYKPVLEYPPVPLPPRAPPTRSDYDLPVPAKSYHRHFKPPKPKAPPVFYIEDEVRRQFFKDHPFEAYRPRTLAESGAVEDEHPIRHHAWMRLSQRGKNPSSEDAVKFAVNLHQYHEMPLSEAYATSVMQFRSLRSEHHIATKVAAAEVAAFGHEFDKLEIEKSFDEEEMQLESWASKDATGQESLEARKRWKAVVDTSGNAGRWTRGEEYVRLWKEGARPNYAIGLSPPVEEEKLTDVFFQPPSQPRTGR